MHLFGKAIANPTLSLNHRQDIIIHLSLGLHYFLYRCIDLNDPQGHGVEQTTTTTSACSRIQGQLAARFNFAILQEVILPIRSCTSLQPLSLLHMPSKPSTASAPTASYTHANEASPFPANVYANLLPAQPLQPVQEVAATSIIDSVSSSSKHPTSNQANLSYTTSALQRAGLLPSDTMAVSAPSGASAASETLQRVMGHSAASAAATNGASTPTQAGPLTPAHLKNMTPAQANAALQNPVGNVPTVYLATYSNVPVYEITVRGIAVMRRRGDGWLNATQILKIAGIEKTRRTKILEKSILTGEHEKIQGGYGKFQGTWIPLQRAQEVAAEYNVSHLLQPILEFDPATADQIPKLYQRKKPASSARNSSASAINDGRSATPSKNYSPAPSSAVSQSAASFLVASPAERHAAARTVPALFMPPVLVVCLAASHPMVYQLQVLRQFLLDLVRQSKKRFAATMSTDTLHKGCHFLLQPMQKVQTRLQLQATSEEQVKLSRKALLLLSARVSRAHSEIQVFCLALRPSRT